VIKTSVLVTTLVKEIKTKLSSMNHARNTFLQFWEAAERAFDLFSMTFSEKIGLQQQTKISWMNSLNKSA
jgi:hypothetical protein